MQQAYELPGCVKNRGPRISIPSKWNLVVDPKYHHFFCHNIHTFTRSGTEDLLEVERLSACLDMTEMYPGSPSVPNEITRLSLTDAMNFPVRANLVELRWVIRWPNECGRKLGWMLGDSSRKI